MQIVMTKEIDEETEAALVLESLKESYLVLESFSSNNMEDSDDKDLMLALDKIIEYYSTVKQYKEWKEELKTQTEEDGEINGTETE